MFSFSPSFNQYKSLYKLKTALSKVITPLTIILVILFVLSLVLVLLDQKLLASIMLFIFFIKLLPVLWYYLGLNNHSFWDKDSSNSNYLDWLLPPEISYKMSEASSKALWEAIKTSWQYRFYCNHLMLPPDTLDPLVFSSNLEQWIASALNISNINSSTNKKLTIPIILEAVVSENDLVSSYLLALDINSTDAKNVAKWVRYAQEEMDNSRKGFAKELARDWTAGYTPTLNHFALNISDNLTSSSIENANYDDNMTYLISKLSEPQSKAIAVVAPNGAGKSSLAYHLASILQNSNYALELDGSIQYAKVFVLSSSAIIAEGQKHGFERLLMNIFNEAYHAGKVIIFMDNAELFFQDGLGSINIYNILIPILESKRFKIIMTLDPISWQKMSTTNPNIGSNIIRYDLANMPQEQIYKHLFRQALYLEHSGGRLLITYKAIKASLELSNRYQLSSGFAQPGLSIDLLKSSLSMAKPLNSNTKYIDDDSIIKSLESQTRIKVERTSDKDQKNKLLSLEDLIHTRMINQVRAVKVVADALRRSALALKTSKKPIGSFLFLGPTGVGKTELARSLADKYFGDESMMIRLDMSEYQNTFDLTRLLSRGSGYSFLDQLNEKPHSVIVFDEIEKASPDILNVLLQILEEGVLTDSGGVKNYFTETIIIATSNAGANEIRQEIDKGRSLEAFEDEFINHIIDSQYFRPELLNRFDDIVLFRPLNPNELKQVAGIIIAGLNKSLAKQNLSLTISEAGLDYLVSIGYDPRLGSRPLRRAIGARVENKISKMVLGGQTHSGMNIHFDVKDLQ